MDDDGFTNLILRIKMREIPFVMGELENNKSLFTASQYEKLL